ncbi:ABC transporter substrate-binding protein [Camelimonas abortus]|uniref:ABC transporter substrate-binding protein n=1 Tax=Camelimonas abortus TaxID=1017184 RepID=A0ABV7LFJ6_9HYPH
MKKILTAAMCLALGLSAAHASDGKAGEKKYGPGASDTEIRIGNVAPYSGPASAYSVRGSAIVEYFRQLNEKGGINGRKVTVISLDDAYSPPKAVEQTRKLVENENVLAVYGSVGTPSNSAVHKYLNARQVPQLLVATGASKWNDPKNYPWTTAMLPLYDMEAKIYANYVLRRRPDGKVAILYQNDDFGKDFVRGFREGLGDRARSMIAIELPYEITSATVDAEVVRMKATGADILFIVATPKFAAQVIKRTHELGWKPLQMVVSVSASIGSVLKPAGLDASQGVITAVALKEPDDPQWADSEDMKAYKAFMKSIGQEGMIDDSNAVQGYVAAVLLERILRRAGDNLTRENIRDIAANMHEENVPMMLPGIVLRTTPDDYSLFDALYLQRFEGDRYVLIEGPVSGK